MILGRVTDDEAVITLTLFAEDNVPVVIKAVLDTGFTEYLTLPRDVVARLGLSYTEDEEVVLADGSTTFLELYKVRLLWDDVARTVAAYAVDSGILVGMKLLRGSFMTMDVSEGGEVTIEAPE